MRKENCTEIIEFITPKGEQKKHCRKHFCICKDEYPHDSDLNQRYQKAKLKGEAKDGIFLKK